MGNNLVYLSFGSNIGDRVFYLNLAMEGIENVVGRIVKSSSVYESEAWGFEGENFLNQCVLMETKYDAMGLLERLQGIEKVAGRKVKHGKGYVSRELDIDILFFNDRVVEEKGLSVPHPLLQERMFVLAPLNEIAGGFVHPLLNKTVKELYANCGEKDKTSVRKI